MRKRRARAVDQGADPNCSIATSNGEVERPRASAGSAPRSHTVFQRPRRLTTHASRPAPVMVRLQCGLHEPLHVRCGVSPLLERRFTRQLSGVAQPAAGLVAATNALTLAKTSNLEFANASQCAAVRPQVTTPDVEGTGPFFGSAS